MEISKSPIEEQIEAQVETEAEEQAQQAEHDANAAKVLKVLRGIRNGSLTFKQFKELPKQVQVSYERRYGRPKTLDQIRAADKVKTKRRSASKRARASRKGR